MDEDAPTSSVLSCSPREVFVCSGDAPARQYSVPGSTVEEFRSALLSLVQAEDTSLVTAFNPRYGGYVLLESLSDLDTAEGKVRVEAQRRACGLHHQAFVLWCTTDHVPVCPCCVASQRHQGHTFEDFGAALDRERSALLNAIPVANRRRDELQGDIAGLETQIRTAQEMLSAAQERCGSVTAMLNRLEGLQSIEVNLDGDDLSVLMDTISRLRTDLKEVLPVFQHESDFDTNGVFYHLGTNGGAVEWTNPMQAGKCIVTPSHNLYCGKAADMVGHTEAATLQIMEALRGTKASVAFDLRPARLSILPSAYTLRNRHNADGRHLTNWTFEASNDGTEWVEVDKRINDSSTQGAGGSHTFPVECNASYGLFRVRMTGADRDGGNWFSLGGFELYGTASPCGT